MIFILSKKALISTMACNQIKGGIYVGKYTTNWSIFW